MKKSFFSENRRLFFGFSEVMTNPNQAPEGELSNIKKYFDETQKLLSGKREDLETDIVDNRFLVKYFEFTIIKYVKYKREQKQNVSAELIENIEKYHDSAFNLLQAFRNGADEKGISKVVDLLSKFREQKEIKKLEEEIKALK